MRRTGVIISALLAAGALLAACGGASTGSEVRSHEPRDPVDQSSVAPDRAGQLGLAADLYRALAEQNQNFVFSPYGVSVGLAMAGAGAGGRHRGPARERPARDRRRRSRLAGLNALDQQLEQRNGEQTSDVRKGRVTLEFPVSLWGQKDTRFEDPFLDTLSRSFGTGIRVVDFRSDPDASRRAINSWIRDQSKGSIEELIPRGSVTDTSRLIVSEAATIQAPWDIPFDTARTAPAPFTMLDGSTQNVTMMGLAAPTGLLYARGDGWQAAALPYLGRQLEMVVLVPDAGRSPTSRPASTEPSSSGCWASCDSTSLDLQLPRFGFTTQGDLDDPAVRDRRTGRVHRRPGRLLGHHRPTRRSTSPSSRTRPSSRSTRRAPRPRPPP